MDMFWGEGALAEAAELTAADGGSGD